MINVISVLLCILMIITYNYLNIDMYIKEVLALIFIIIGSVISFKFLYKKKNLLKRSIFISIPIILILVTSYRIEIMASMGLFMIITYLFSYIKK